MKTTVQIKQNTLELLRKVRENTHSSSYDEALNKLIIRNINKESLFGYLGKGNKNIILKGLRDKSDRI